MDTSIAVPLGAFAMVVLIVVIPAYFKSREKKEMQATLRAAIAQGQPVPPELIEALTRDTVKRASGRNDLRTGLVWLAVAVGIGVFAVLVGFEDREPVYPLIGIAAIPGCIGLAFIVLSLFNKTKG